MEEGEEGGEDKSRVGGEGWGHVAETITVPKSLKLSVILQEKFATPGPAHPHAAGCLIRQLLSPERNDSPDNSESLPPMGWPALLLQAPDGMLRFPRASLLEALTILGRQGSIFISPQPPAPYDLEAFLIHWSNNQAQFD